VRVDPALARTRVAEAREGRLGTVTPAGRPHLVPCCFALLGDVAYTAVDGKPKSTLDLQRLENIRANPAASLLVDHYEENWSLLWWVRLDGTARVVESASEEEWAKAALATKYPQYRDIAIPGAAIALDITRWVSWP
jgi:PPOX class probable F420-dependent enzyme